MIDANLLALFVEVVEAGSLSAAGRRLEMSRSNVSARLKLLEQHLGQQLLRRTSRSINLTEIGARLYEHGCTIRSELQAAYESATHLGRGLHGRVCISVPSAFGQIFMYDWLIEFKQQHPGIMLDVVFENWIDDLVRDHIDIAIRVLSVPPDSLVARDLGPMHYVLCASAQWIAASPAIKSLDDLSRAPIITSSSRARGSYMPITMRKGNDIQNLTLKCTLVSENYMFLRRCILDGIGVGLVPQYLLPEALESGEVIQLLPEWQPTTLGSRLFMLFMPGRTRTKAVTTLIAFINEKVRASGRMDADPLRPAPDTPIALAATPPETGKTP